MLESSLGHLYDSAVDAFPNTTRRQHATNTIKVVDLKWVPFIGMKTLMIRGTVHNEDREYNPLIIFKRVEYFGEQTAGAAILTASDEKQYFLKKLSLQDHDVLVRCGCKDFFWRFNYYDHVDKSLQGRARKPYTALHNPGTANPTESEGICKHLMKMMKVLSESGIIS